jgi:F-type H+-transporting ATPase subunit delta
MSIEVVARRYASALADVVLKTGETETVKGELLQWSVIINANTDLYDAFNNPAIPRSQKEKVLQSLIERTRPAKTTANFLRVLLRNGRLTVLSRINERFAAELEERSGIVSAEVISARELPAGERSELQSRLEKLTGKQIKLNFNINQDIIGGVITRIGSTVYDGSVKTRLENLKQQLVNG